MAIYGYARISRPTQSIDRQIRNIEKAYKDAVIIKEKYTGTSMERPAWNKLMKIVKAGDTIVFDSVSRFSRSADDGFNAYQTLFNNNVTLIFLKEPTINTETYKQAMSSSIPMTGTSADLILEGVNKFLMELAKQQIQLAFAQAEKEVEDLHQRTKEGLVTAKMNGKRVGQPKGATLTTKKSITTKEKIQKYSKDFGGTLNDVECMELTHVSRNTYYKYKRELMSAQKENEG